MTQGRTSGRQSGNVQLGFKGKMSEFGRFTQPFGEKRLKCQYKTPLH